MGRFQFSLERVLEIRTSQESAAAARLAAANAQLSSCRTNLEGTLGDLRALQEDASRGSVDPSLAHRIASGLRQRISSTRREAEVKQLEVSKAADSWRHACRQKDLLEKLREARHSEHQRVQQRIQELALDEWAVQRRHDP
jgi:flagellar export protein FliJ